jgi:hypothetical protein
VGVVEHQTAGREERHPNEAPGTELRGTLAVLDWHEFTCQSEAGCTNRATHIVHLHAVDQCSHPYLDSSGNIISILCAGCLSGIALEFLRQVERLKRFPDSCCLTCGAPVGKLTDIVREVSVL